MKLGLKGDGVSANNLMMYDEEVAEIQAHMKSELKIVEDLLLSYQKNIKDPAMRDYAVEQLECALVRVRQLDAYVKGKTSVS